MTRDELQELAEACEVSARNLGTTVSGMLHLAANPAALDHMARAEAIISARRTVDNEIGHLNTALTAAIAALEA